MNTHLQMMAAAVLLAGVLLCSGCGRRDAPAAVSPPTPVRVATVEEVAAADSVRAIGRVAPADEVRLAFKNGGVVRAIHVAQGDRIRRGQLLAILVDDEVAAALAQARALADKAERDLDRGRALLAEEVATREQVEDLVTVRAVADASLRAAQFNTRQATIEAPAGGIVLQRLAEPDELVAPGQPVLVVGNTDGGWIVRAALSDRDIVRVQAGVTAEVTLDALPGLAFPATVTEIAAAADPATGTYEMKLALDAGDQHLVQGLVAKVVLAGPRRNAVPVVPVTALLEADGSLATVFVVVADATVARRVPVRIGRLVGERVEILDGLAPGERVVTEGAAWLSDGATVRVLDGR